MNQAALAPKKPLNNIQHAAYRCRDAEQTRWFWEDVLGFELVISLVGDKDPSMDIPYQYMHLFFVMGDGNLIAFFDAPDDANEDMFIPGDGYDLHVAFECKDMNELKEWQAHIASKGIAVSDPIDHDFVQSIYMYDPNGIQVEVTTKTDTYNDTVVTEKAKAHDIIKKWTADTRAKKEAKFGADRVDMRSDICLENITKIVERKAAYAETVT